MADAEHSTLTLDDSGEEPIDQLRGHSITYRIAVGPQQGRKVFTLQTLPGVEEPCSGRAGQATGFSRLAGVAAAVQQRDKLECLCRYIIRPAVSEKRLSLTNQGKARYELNPPRMVQIFDRTVRYCYQTILWELCPCNDLCPATLAAPRNYLGRLA
jgi:hypothetical protein